MSVHRSPAASLVTCLVVLFLAGSARAGELRFEKAEDTNLPEIMRAWKAERAAIEMKKFRFLAKQIESENPQTYPAVVVKVMNFGMFVDVPELQISGMVHVSVISERFVRFSRRDSTLRAEGRVYKVGARLDVCPVKVDFDSRRIDFSLA